MCSVCTFLRGPFKNLLIDSSKTDLWRDEGPGQFREMAGNGMNLLCIGHILLYVLSGTVWTNQHPRSSFAIVDEDALSELFEE